MAILVAINGAPGSGKSTLARRLAEGTDLMLVLDVDGIRGTLGGWRHDPIAAGMAARRLALAMAGEHLAGGRDVVVPQFLQRPVFLDDLRATAEQHDATFVEVCLVSSPAEAADRFAARARSADPLHQDAAWLQAQDGAADVREMYEAMLQMIDQRPRTIRVTTEPGQIDATLARLRDAITMARVADQPPAHSRAAD